MEAKDSVLETIGETPLVKVQQLSTDSVDVYAKLEGFDPTGSIKGRIARRMIEQAERVGELESGDTVIEHTSGNTGIAVAMVAGRKGYDVTLVMPSDMSIERVQIMRALGADVVLTPPGDEDGAIEVALSMVEESPDEYWLPDQFANDDNTLAHHETTGPEIWEQLDGSITHFIAGWGTSGTLMGVGGYLKEQDPSIEVIGIEPESCEIQGLKSFEDGMTPEIFEPEVVDRRIAVDADTAMERTAELARSGLFMGQSSGANAAGVERIVDEIEEGTVVTVFADFGFKYLSSQPYHEDGLEERVRAARERGDVTRL